MIITDELGKHVSGKPLQIEPRAGQSQDIGISNISNSDCVSGAGSHTVDVPVLFEKPFLISLVTSQNNVVS